MAVSHLFRKSMYSACLMSPVLIMMVWKHCRSMAHSFTWVRATKHTFSIMSASTAPRHSVKGNILKGCRGKDLWLLWKHMKTSGVYSQWWCVWSENDTHTWWKFCVKQSAQKFLHKNFYPEIPEAKLLLSNMNHYSCLKSSLLTAARALTAACALTVPYTLTVACTLIAGGC